MSTFTSNNPSLGAAASVFQPNVPPNVSLYRTTILSNAKSSQSNNNVWSIFGRFSYTDIRYNVSFLYNWMNINFLQFVGIDVVNSYNEPTQNPNSNPGLRTINNGFGNPFYTNLPLSLNGPWSAWGYGPYGSGNRFTSINQNTNFTWTFECWVRPIYNSAGTIDPYIGQQLDFMYPTPYIVNDTRISYASFETSQGCGSGLYCQFGLLVDQYKVIITNSFDDGTFCVGKYYINFDTSKFYQIVVEFLDNAYGGYYTLFINGEQVYSVTPYACYPYALPWLDLSLLLNGTAYNGGSNPFFVGWSSQFKAWSRPLTAFEVMASYNYSAHRYGLPQKTSNPGSICAYSPTYNMYTTHLMYDNGSVVDTGGQCAPLP